ncbi:MAG: YdbL family protein [Candidatus Omnitrophica bacterium]|nr:YdbL family protein [Candidatus Omnitrophota bacterium]MCM8827140.1 YdbL family protein [Candidatus Omnitrophota bacterium]
MKRKFFIMAILGVFLGCARVRVEAPQQPIKVDITMRLDIYQHVQKDIDSIEDLIKGRGNNSEDNQSFIWKFVPNVYAQESFLVSKEIEGAVLRRKERLKELIPLQSKGIIGENSLGLLELRLPQTPNTSLKELVKSENDDRMIIYSYIAKKDNVPLIEVQKMYALRHQQDAPQGTPIEVLVEPPSVYEWRVK